MQRSVKPQLPKKFLPCRHKVVATRDFHGTLATRQFKKDHITMASKKLLV